MKQSCVRDLNRPIILFKTYLSAKHSRHVMQEIDVFKCKSIVLFGFFSFFFIICFRLIYRWNEEKKTENRNRKVSAQTLRSNGMRERHPKNRF